MNFNGIVSAVFDLFFPRLCLRCGKVLNASEEYICPACIADIPRTNFHLHSHNYVEKAFAGKAHANRAFSWFYFSHNGSFNKFIYHIKYKGNAKFARFLGDMYATELKNDGIELAPDIIIPVPLHRKRLKSRGYNQSLLIAQGIQKHYGGVIREDILIRNVETKSQTNKKRFDRWENIKDVFSVVFSDDSILSKRVLLVDDVTTTGATLSACIITLRECGFENIEVLTLAYSDNR